MCKFYSLILWVLSFKNQHVYNISFFLIEVIWDVQCVRGKLFKLLFFPSEWHFYIWKEKTLNIEFWVVSTHIVKILDHLNEHVINYVRSENDNFFLNPVFSNIFIRSIVLQGIFLNMLMESYLLKQDFIILTLFTSYFLNDINKLYALNDMYQEHNYHFLLHFNKLLLKCINWIEDLMFIGKYFFYNCLIKNNN